MDAFRWKKGVRDMNSLRSFSLSTQFVYTKASLPPTSLPPIFASADEIFGQLIRKIVQVWLQFLGKFDKEKTKIDSFFINEYRGPANTQNQWWQKP